MNYIIETLNKFNDYLVAKENNIEQQLFHIEFGSEQGLREIKEIESK
ncbi:MAG TPA: hypothetical protein VJB65_01070 [Patescibacteria group bacterium]|nr:hypothetical protein [Patescibacteria group bacterium]